ncbi:flavin reductase family protein [Aspergillus lucknowensis]|uniref:Flavin reductase like domain-containing protein n=1 Tax=Aspergillus lucknowensis TaxID=176173 RepID=A0ABR4LMX9_9EURO
MSHSPISPAILYWGTPVVLITTTNEDNTPNIAPMSSAWWLANRCVLGLAANSQTTLNLLRTKQCVLNLPDDAMAPNVNSLARTTGSKEVPEFKVRLGYRYEKDKFAVAGLTAQDSMAVTPPRIRECPVQMEAELVGTHTLMEDEPSEVKGLVLALEVRVLRTHVVEEIRLAGYANRVDPDKWKPMIMSFQRLYGLKDGQVAESTLAEIEEEKYRILQTFR